MKNNYTILLRGRKTLKKFYLIQRGNFKNDEKSLTGSDGVVNLDYMGATEFEWGAIPKARIELK